MYLAKMNYLEVEEYLKKSDTIVIPVGSLENHGKHMPLGTDTMIPDKIAELLDQKTDLLIAPTINYGATDDLVGFAGTVSLGTEGLIKYEYIELPEAIRNDVSEEIPSGAWTSVIYKGVSVQIPREIKDITDNGWLAHGFKNDAPTRATPEWGRQMVETVADYIADFGAAFGRAPLPERVE